jgi:hypothetical protein
MRQPAQESGILNKSLPHSASDPTFTEMHLEALDSPTETCARIKQQRVSIRQLPEMSLLSMASRATHPNNRAVDHLV